MIPIPFSPDYSRNASRAPTGTMPCAVCGRPIKDGAWAYAVRIVNGGNAIGTDAEGDAEPAADLGLYPLGRDCLRAHPELRPYAKPVERTQP